METWFSPNNGLFIYAPVLILFLIGLVLMIRQGNKMGYFYLFLFAIISYLFASWWNWWFGCSLGARSFVEFYAFFSFPIAYFLQWAWKNPSMRMVSLVFIAMCGFIYFDIEYYYDGCFYGSTWDWQSYLNLLKL